MQGTLRNLFRLAAIIRVLTRYGAIAALEQGVPLVATFAHLLSYLSNRKLAVGRPGQRLAAALEALGPSFVKFGQALSTRSDVLGEDVTRDLSSLQDRLPPFPFESARAIIEGELGRPLDTLYQSFNHTPVAAASIAQVHFAVTAEGQEVAVKVLRPGVEETFATDIGLFLWLARLAERLFPRWRRLRFVDVVKTFEESVSLEMDLRFEAAAAAEMSENFEGDPWFSIPAIDWQRTGRRVLTMERVHGIPIGQVDALIAAGIDPADVTEKAADAFFNMVFRDGFFHADMHPGNLFVGEKGELIAVDFGITGRVDRATRRYLGEMLIGFLSADYRRVTKVHFEAGYVPADQSRDIFTQAVRSIAEPILGKPQAEISIARLLGQLFEVTETFSMEIQPQLLLLQKSMLVAEGVGRNLNPSVNMWHMAEPLITQWMAENLGPQARVRDSVVAVGGLLERLPALVGETERTVEALRAGVRIHPDSLKALKAERRRLFPDWLPWALVFILMGLLLLRR